MQRSDEIRDLFAFNRWANDRMRGAIAALSDEEFARDLKSSYPSIRDTMLHIMGSEWVWLMRWMDNSPSSAPAEWTTFGRPQIEVEWAAIEAAHSAYVKELTDGDLDRVVTYTNFKGETFSQPLWHLMRHMVNHSTYHRGQITTMLRQLGRDAVATDLVVYFRQHSPAIAS
jgi:uncharacterized damage-inducible protein DinB